MKKLGCLDVRRTGSLYVQYVSGSRYIQLTRPVSRVQYLQLQLSDQSQCLSDW